MPRAITKPITTAVPAGATPRHRRLLAGFALMPAPSDTDLIRLCDRLLENQARDRLLCSTWRAPGYPGEDPVVGPQLDALDAEYEDILGRLETMTPATLAGVRALARVALALAEMGGDRDRALRPALEWLAGSDDAERAWVPPAVWRANIPLSTRRA